MRSTIEVNSSIRGCYGERVNRWSKQLVAFTGDDGVTSNTATNDSALEVFASILPMG